MMNNTNTSPKITVSKTAPWTVSVNGELYHTALTRTEARATAADLRENGLPDHRADEDPKALILADGEGEVTFTGASLEAARRARKISLKSMAQTMGTTPYQVWYTEKGKLPVTAEYVTKFEEALATA